MCDPITGLAIASTAASVGGGLYSSYEANNNAQSEMLARNNVLNSFLQKQTAHRKNNEAALTKRVEDMAPQANQQKIDNAVAGRGATIDATTSAPPSDVPLTGSAPKVVKDTVAGALSKAFGEATDAAKAKAKVSGYGDMMLDNQFGIGDTERQIGTTNNFARGEAALLPSQQELAGFAARKPSTGIGQIIQAAGQVGSMYAGSQAGRPGVVAAPGAMPAWQAPTGYRPPAGTLWGI
jgi:hypothetical protein